MKRTAPALVLALMLAVGLAAPAAHGAAVPPPPVEEPALQARIDAVLEAFPGGTQIADDTVAWQRGEVQLTLEGGSNARSVGSCSTGKYCAWSGTAFSGIKLSFSACSSTGISNSLAPLGATARSLANARTTGTVHAKNGSTVVYILGPGGSVLANSAALTTMTCYT